jgi:hypothetical protein
MSEHQEQSTFFAWVRLNREIAPSPEVRKAMKLCYSVPNGDYSNPKSKHKSKQAGLEKGMPDINLDWPVWDYRECESGLRIEMKFGKGKLSPEQKEKKVLLEEAGFKVAVCYSAQEAIREVFNYLNFKETDYQGIKEFLR